MIPQPELDGRIVAALERIPKDFASQQLARQLMHDYRRRAMLAAAAPVASKQQVRARIWKHRWQLLTMLEAMIPESDPVTTPPRNLRFSFPEGGGQ